MTGAQDVNEDGPLIGAAQFVERLVRANIRIAHAWGMTETSPISTIAYESADWDELSFEDKVSLKSMQGKPLFGVELRTVDLGDASQILPRDRMTSGALQVRAPDVILRNVRAVKWPRIALGRANARPLRIKGKEVVPGQARWIGQQQV